MVDRPVRNINGQAPILSRAMATREWDALLELGRPVTFSKGDTIMLHGSDGTHMYLIREGRVEISITSAEGNKGVLNQMGPGEMLGEIALLDGGPRSADAVAASPVVALIAIDQGSVLRALQGSPDVVVAVIRELCRRVRNASEMFEVKSEKNAKVRLARALLRLSAKWGEGTDNPKGARLLKGFSQSDLGDFAGLARENVNRHLKALQDEGLIARHDDGITLLELDAIADQAQL
ncbi:MAG: Crp/Fnr family transcriptional regulator [Pseudomonadota bacterium]